MANTQQAQIDTLRSIAFGSISGSYAAVGSALTYGARLIAFTNATNGDLFVSTDGSTNMLFLLANSFKLFDLTTNRSINDPVFVFVPGTQFFVKQSSAPSSGTFNIEVIYATQTNGAL